MAAQNKGKISYILHVIHAVPLVVFAVVILAVGANRFTNSMYDQVKNELESTSRTLITMYDTLYPGDYAMVGDSSLRFYKGDADLTNDFELIDRIKDDTGLDITVFYQDTRILTTITDGYGSRIVGSGAPEVILNSVLPTGDYYYNENLHIYGVSYIAYYAPLFNSDGSVTGMLFVGRPCANVDAAIQKATLPLTIVVTVLTLAIIISVFLYTRSFLAPLLKLHTFLGLVSAGKMDTALDPDLLKRKDELGDMARNIQEMQHSLNVMINQDTLTSLANRKAGTMKLRQAIKNQTDYGTPFCVAIGNIDYFKKINDTFGHDYGDTILKNVSDKLRQHMRDKGTVARWSGEEFLFIYENMTMDSAVSAVEDLLKDIRSMINRHEDKRIKVTMTFGISSGDSMTNMTDLLRLTDEKLRQGKANGRNQIVQ